MNRSKNSPNGQLMLSSADGRFVEIHELTADGRGGLRRRLVSRSPVSDNPLDAAMSRAAERQAVRRLLLDIFAPAPDADD